MKKTMIILASCALFMMMQSAVWAQGSASLTSADPTAALRQEIRQLKLEVLQQGIEFQTWKIQQLEKELARVQEKKQRLDTQERSVQQQIAELNVASNAGGEGSETMEIKETLSQKSLKQISDAQEPLVRQETELLNQLEQERNRLAQLQLRAKRIKASE